MRLTPSSSSASVLRGLVCAIPAAAVGFAIPYLVLLKPGSLSMYELLHPATGVAIVFGLAAILEYTPPSRIGFLRAMIHVGIATFVAFFLTEILSKMVGIDQRSYDDPHRWIRVLNACGLLVACTIWQTVRRIARDTGGIVVDPQV